MMPLGLKQFRNSGCLSYVVYCPQQNQAILIDPHLQLLEEYRDFLAIRRLKLVTLFDTHTHADHYSASHLIKTELKANIAMCYTTQSARASLKLHEKESLKLGSLIIEIIETPGHTPDSICIRVGDCVFTGDTLLIGSQGRTDFPGADPKMLSTSIEKLFNSLPLDSIVFPAHDYNDLLFSTLEIERGFKSLVHECVTPHTPPLSPEVRACIQYNLSENPQSVPIASSCGSFAVCGEVPKTANMNSYALSVDKYFNKLSEKSSVKKAFIDVRERDEFTAGHIPSTKNIPLSELAFHLSDLRKFDRLYFSCLSGRRSLMATKTLVHLGFENCWNITGGFKAWQSGGYPIESP